jgi:hypothetical protein
MVRRWSAIVSVVLVVGLAACSSDGGSSADALPKLTRKDWTKAGLATAKATTAAIAAGIAGQCADPGVSDINQLPFGMQQVRSKIVPTAQMTCDVNDEVVEISVFATKRERDRFVSDRSTGLCRLAKAQAVKYKSRLTFPGIRWDVGAGNVTVQPDSESLARRLAGITKGRYDPRGCAKGITVEWDTRAVHAIDALGQRIAGAGHGCDFVNLVPRESLDQTRKLTDAQLPAAYGSCTFDVTPVQLITWVRPTHAVKNFVDEQVRKSCVGDPATGRIEGDGYAVIAPGTIAEQVHAAVGGTLAPTSCT